MCCGTESYKCYGSITVAVHVEPVSLIVIYENFLYTDGLVVCPGIVGVCVLDSGGSSDNA